MIENERYSEFVHCVKIFRQQMTKKSNVETIGLYFGTNYIPSSDKKYIYKVGYGIVRTKI